MYPEPLISIIVINFNGQEHLIDCLDALCNDLQSPNFEIIVADNASTDKSLQILEQYTDGIKPFTLLKSDQNLGYAGGINYALSLAKGNYIAILNMDTKISPGWLTSIINFFEEHPNTGAISPLMLLDDSSERVNAIGQSVHLTGLGFNRGLSVHKKDVGKFPIRVSGIHGGAFVIPRLILNQTGGLDEIGFLYHEDVNISWLLQIMGYDLYCLPDSFVHHDYDLTMYAEKLYLLERNRVAMLVSYLNIKTMIALLPILLFTEILIWGFCAIRGFEFLKSKANSYRWVLNQRLHINKRKIFINSIRKRSDWQLLKHLSWNYSWDQFIKLGNEGGKSERQPKGGLNIRGA